MGKWLIGALLAATAWTPVAAQDGGGRREGRRQQREVQAQAQPSAQVQARGGWDRGQARVDAQGQSGGGWPASRQERQQAQAARRQTQAQPDVQNGNDRRDPSRRDRGVEVQAQAQAQASRDARAQALRDRDTRQERATRGGAFQATGDARVQANRNRDGGNDRFENRNDRGNGYADGRGYQSQRNDGRRYDNRGSWSRSWRQDNRYDWNRFRSSNRSSFRLPRYYAPGGWHYGYRRFSIGVVLTTALWGQNYWIDDPWSYRLPEAYGPYRWVRYYNDALLVDVRSGEVVDTVYDIFWY